MKRDKIAIIGAGRVGTALAVSLHQRGYPVVGVASRTLASAKRCGELTGCTLITTSPSEAAQPGSTIFITTPDGVIGKVCQEVAQGGAFKKGDLVVHASGSLDSGELISAREKEALTLSMHPVQSFTDLQSAIENLPGSYFGLEGEEEAIERGKELVAHLDGRAVVIAKGGKALYHAAACVASNYLISLVHLSLKLYEKAGIPKEEGSKMLLPLIDGTTANAARLGIPSALTGPIDRGDAEILRHQLSAIRDKAPEVLRTFTELAAYTLEVAEGKGTLTAERTEELRELLKKG